MRRILYIMVVIAAMALGTSSAQAAPPMVKNTWVTDVGTTSANLRAEIDPQGQPTTYLFEYTSETNYRAKGFAGASRIPATGVAIGGNGLVLQHTAGLDPDTGYRFRAVATNNDGVKAGAIRRFTTREAEPVFRLPDARGWEMVSPINKNGGSIQSFGANFGGGVIQAAAQGSTVTYTSASSFQDPQGAPGAGQYISRRGRSAWSTENVTPPGVSGSYPGDPVSGVPYQLFSSDLSSALLSNGRRCRKSVTKQCPVENPPLAGSEAPEGYRNYYVRNNSNGSFGALLTSADLAELALGAEDFEVALVGATPSLDHVVLSSCAKLSANATEVAGTDGECDDAKQNLYVKSGSALPKLVNLLPGETIGTPGATLAAQSGAISTDASRIYWTHGKNLYLRDGAQTKQVDAAAGGEGTFQTASADGSVAYFTTGELVTPPKHPEETPEEEELSTPFFSLHLWRYLAATDTATDLTPAGGVLGVLGTSDDGTSVYYAKKTTFYGPGGVFLWRAGVLTPIAASVATDSYPPTTGTARVSADGRHLLYVSSAFEITGYDSRHIATGKPAPEVYLFTAPGAIGSGNICVSCNPFGERPTGAASLPGAAPNGVDGLYSYKPRVLSADSRRVFFDTFDALASQDTNEAKDVYQWEEFGSGDCVKQDGCIRLISSGRAENGASFLDASVDGSDAFFLTDGSLVPSDPGGYDVYDARVGGGYPLPPSVVPCFGDTCQALPPEPDDPTPGTERSKTSGNLPTPPPKKPLKCKKNQVKRFGKCIKEKPSKKKARTKKGRSR
jgi:hypothetical protein